MPDVKRTFTIGGESVTLSRSSILSAVRGVQPRAVKKYSVVIDGVRYPIMQVLSVATGKPPVAIRPELAYRVLHSLKFEVETV